MNGGCGGAKSRLVLVESSSWQALAAASRAQAGTNRARAQQSAAAARLWLAALITGD